MIIAYWGKIKQEISKNFDIIENTVGKMYNQDIFFKEGYAYEIL